ncbi:30S ribosomal protein S21 [Neorickettsia findlayensis]|uniref:Small ribosomal subunit protein bS21 n=1 Tax=Neorickettsia findlayensis TaxID=2686014 RepID=A0A6P1GAW5_9RICK|nr:30S ribosomal protein S21 [Neorickettsia findlayensis]QHD65440.1 30S ribosomal protein S21 [Neorickettsia findlayensis]
MGQVFMVHHGDVEQALRRLKQHLSREGITPGKKRIFEKPSEKRHRRVVETRRKIRKQKLRVVPY